MTTEFNDMGYTLEVRYSPLPPDARSMFPATGGSSAAGHLSCAAKKGNRKKAAPGGAPRVRGVTLCCLPR